jgi:hypothetical protein
MFINASLQAETSVANNLLLLKHIRVIIKFYIWPLLVTFGLTGNILSIFVLTRRRLIRTSTNNYLTILAAFDSCYLILTLILNIGSHPAFAQHVLTRMLLAYIRPLADFSSNTAAWLIVCFTLERTLAVTRPIYAKRTCSVRRSRHVILTLLVICFILTIPTYFDQRHANFSVNSPSTEFNQTTTINLTQQSMGLSMFHRWYLVFICIIIVWIPLLLLCICNSILIWWVSSYVRCLRLFFFPFPFIFTQLFIV